MPQETIGATTPALDEERLAWLALALAPGLGPKRILDAVKNLDSASQIFTLPLTARPRATTMWFITLVKMRKAPKPEEAAQMNKMMQEAAAKMGIKIHQGFMTLGRYDAVWISEAPDISGPMRMSMMGGDAAESETLVATSYEEAMKWTT